MTLLLTSPWLLSAGAHAASIPFKRGEVKYPLQERPLVDFLQEFFADQGLSVVISGQLRARGGSISGQRAGSPQKVFASIAGSNDLISYYDGSAVYLYLSQERTTRYANLPPARVEDFVGAFQKMKLGDDGNSFSATSGNGLVMITGTPRFVEQVQQLADAVNGQGPSNATVFKYYKLRYAWAADTTMTIGNRQQTVPGVATLLRELVGATAPPAMAAPQDRLLRPTSTKLRGSGLAGIGQSPTDTEARHDAGDIAPAQPVSSAVDAGPGARIVADTFRNAVIVRDAPDRIGMYDRLIQSLDVEPQMVEIEATIIDVDKGKMKNLGVDWRYRNSGGRGEVDFLPSETQPNSIKPNFVGAINGRGLNGVPTRNDNIDTLNQLAGFQLGAIIGDSSRFLLRINALSSDNVTNVVARPQVVTLNDTEAIIENSQTIYVPVAGAYDVDLFNVVAGTVLQVTPHMIYENGLRRIRMMVQIEDGNVVVQQSATNGQNVNIPLVTRKAVNTQALIDEGQSLLLGGLISDTDTNNTDKIPVLGDVPLLGNLFKKAQKNRERVERLFLITPRLLAANRITSQDVPSTPGVNIDQIRMEQEARDHAELPWASDEEKARQRGQGVPSTSTKPAATAPSPPLAPPTTSSSKPAAVAGGGVH
ncbi:MAG: type III secretion system outer membrane ring subunit SctC [Dokdonella sp.]